MPGTATRMIDELTSTTSPWARSTMAGPRAAHSRWGPRKFTVTSLANASGSVPRVVPGTTSDFGAFGAPPAPSGVPYLQSNSVENDDVVEVVFGAAQSSVGAYFDTASNLFEGGSLRMEFYAGDTLLGILAAVPVGDTFGGWVGGTAGEAVITRVIFREMDADTPISFRIDDLTFEIPGPHVLGCLAVGGLCRGARRRRG